MGERGEGARVEKKQAMKASKNERTKLRRPRAEPKVKSPTPSSFSPSLLDFQLPLGAVLSASDLTTEAKGEALMPR
jgi:hypothetical protein